MDYAKRIASIAMIGGTLVLTGCSFSATSIGPMQYHEKTAMQSASLKEILKNATTLVHYCPTGIVNDCGPVLDLRFAGPAATYAYEHVNQKNLPDTEQKGTIQDISTNFGNVLSRSAGIGVASQTGPAMLGLSMFLLFGNSNSHKVNPVPGAYDNLATNFRAGNILWIARYYKDPRNAFSKVSKLAHKAVLLSSLQPATWTKGTYQDATYGIQHGIWNGGADALLVWGRQTPTMTETPPIRPAVLNWIVQPWRKPTDPFYFVNNADPKYPFMALATIEYKIAQGFDVPQWIKAHQNQLQGWMVIYHKKGHAEVWESGKVTQYPDPKPLVVKDTKDK